MSPATCAYLGHKASLVQYMSDATNNSKSSLFLIFAVVFVYLKYKMSDHVFRMSFSFSGHLCFVTKQDKMKHQLGSA